MRIVIKIVLIAAFTARFALAGPIEDCQEYSKYGVPSKDGDILCRKGYLLSHNPNTKTPAWVIEHLTKEKANGDLARTNDFRADPELAQGKRAELSDYKKSGYDQGHMAPAADMAWDEQAMRESFYLSNMVPQVGIGMNRGIWKDLEGKVRQWAIDRGEVYIVTGPIYDFGSEPKTVGNNKVGVPNRLYKIIFDPVKMQAIAFVMPNERLTTADMPKYISTVREIEALTGLDFFNTISADVQKTIETAKATELW